MTDPTPTFDYAAIGDRVFAQLTREDKAAMVAALKVCQRDPEGEDDFQCALGNLDYDTPVGPGEKVLMRDVARMCRMLAEFRMRAQVDDIEWSRLLSGGFGAGEERIAALYVAEGLPETKPDRDGLPGLTRPWHTQACGDRHGPHPSPQESGA